MSLSKRTKDRLDIAMGSKKAADSFAASLAANSALDQRGKRELEIALADKKAAAEIASDEVEIAADLQAAIDTAQSNLDAYVAPAFAHATLDLTADITLTSAAAGAARNTNTFTLQILAAAANPTNTVLAAFTGSAAAITLTITPNDGTNNSATPVDLTTAQIAELINSGSVAGKSVTVTDTSSRRALQTASGGDSTIVADGGEGDGVVGTFSGGVTEVGNLPALEAALAAAEAAASAAKVSPRSKSVMDISLVDKDAAEELKEAIEE